MKAKNRYILAPMNEPHDVLYIRMYQTFQDGNWETVVMQKIHEKYNYYDAQKMIRYHREIRVRRMILALTVKQAILKYHFIRSVRRYLYRGTLIRINKLLGMIEFYIPVPHKGSAEKMLKIIEILVRTGSWQPEGRR